MIGFPNELRTKQDYLNAVDFVKSTGTDKTMMIAKLESLKSNTNMMVLKDSSKSKLPEKQTQEDYVLVPDPDCEMKRLGFTEAEINSLIGGLK